MKRSFVGVDFKPQGDEKIFDVPPPAVEGGFVLCKKHEVVAVTEIGFTAQILFNKIVQFVQIDVGPKLAGLVADGQTP